MTLSISIAEIEVPMHLRRNTSVLELMESLKEKGMIHPIIVNSENGCPPYKLVIGYRRLEAAKKLGWLRIPCYVHNNKELL